MLLLVVHHVRTHELACAVRDPDPELGVLLAFATEYMRTPRRQGQEAEVSLRALPTNTAVLGREERIAANGAPRQDYLPSRQQRPGSALPPGRQDDNSQG